MSFAEGQHFYLSGEVMHSWVGFFYIRYLKDCLHKAELAQKTCLTQWKRNVHKNLWDHLLLIISALTKKMEVFWYIHFLLLFQLNSPKWIPCKEISNLQLLPMSKQNIAKMEREKLKKSKIFFCFQNMFIWDGEQLKVKGWDKNRG